MKILFKGVNLKKVDIDFLKSSPQKENQSEMVVDREKAVESGPNPKVMFVNSSYNFSVNGVANFFVFQSSFEIAEVKDLKEFEKEQLDKILELILLPQEITLIKDVLSKFGVNVRDGLPMGVEFHV